MNRSEEQRRGAPRTAESRRDPRTAGALLALSVGTVLLFGLVGGPAHEPARSGVVGLATTTSTTNLTVAISASSISGVVPLTVEFTAEVNGAIGSSPTVTWSFGDGGGGTGPRLNYTFERSGSYTARATVEDSADRFANASIGITATAPDGNGSTPDGPTPLPPSLVYVAAIAVGVAIGAIGYRVVVGRRSGPSSATTTRPPNDPPSVGATADPAAPSPSSIGADALSVPPSVAPSPPPKLPLPAEAAGVNLSTTASEERRRLSERVITHLLWYGRPTTEGIARSEATQQGMARLLDAGQNSVSKVLLRLEAAGVVKVQTEHVPGAPRRVKTYTLTARGEAVARAIERASGRRGPSS